MYLSLFSGIEAASVAWKPLGWQCVGVAEIDPFPCAVLAHHYPDVPNLGSVTDITDEQIAALGPIDVVVGGSPCFTAGHLVLCKRGLIPIEDVAVGDEVWTHAHRWRAVTATMTRRAPTVRMRGQGHAAMRSTPDHKFYAARTQRTWNGHGYTRSVVEPEWVAASDMAGKRWATPIEITGLAAPQDLESLDAAYLAGLYLGDGHIGKHAEKVKKAVILSVGNHKRDRLAERLRAAWGVITVTPHGESVTRLQLSRTRVACALLREFGEYCHRKTIPPWALCAPREWREALLAGVLDTDGSPIANGYRITTVSRALAVGLRLLAASLGYATTLDFTERPPQTVIDGRTVNQRDTWTVYMRKAARASELRAAGHAWGLVRSVSDAGVDTVYDITVDEDHSFVCDGLVVHNCQDLSVAGKRAGLAGERSGLFHEQLRIFHAARHLCGARFLVWENVPGAFSSNAGRDFAVVVGAMAGCRVDVPDDGWGTEGVALGQHGLVEWAVLDAQFFGVAQRRRRVFAVLDTGDWTGRPPILLEPDRLRGDSAPSREARKDTAGSTGDGVARCITTGESKRQDWEPCNFVAGIAPTLQAGGNSTGGDRPPGTTVDTADSLIVAHTLRGEGFDAGEDGTGRGTPIVPVAVDVWNQSIDGDVAATLNAESGAPNHSGPKVMVPVAFNNTGAGWWSDAEVAATVRKGDEQGGGGARESTLMPVPIQNATRGKDQNGLGIGHAGDPMYTLDQGSQHAIAFMADDYKDGGYEECDTARPLTTSADRTRAAPVIAFSGKDYGADAGEVAPTLRSMGHDGSHANGGGQVAVAVSLRGREGGATAEIGDEVGNCLRASGGGGDKAHVLAAMQVRRLTTVECARLQGFPDDYLMQVPWRGKPHPPDGPMYKALGNSMAVPVMRWIGRQIAAAARCNEAAA